MRSITAIVISLSIFGALDTVHGQANSSSKGKPLPRFEDFRVPTPLPKRKDPAFVPRPDNKAVADFRRSIRAEAQDGPDFAGHYAVVKWTCGMVCFNMVIVDVRTGRIFDTPFVGIGECKNVELVSFRLNSRLLVLTGSLEIPDKINKTFRDGPCGAFYYEWTGSGLKLVYSALDKP